MPPYSVYLILKKLFTLMSGSGGEGKEAVHTLYGRHRTTLESPFSPHTMRLLGTKQIVDLATSTFSR